MKDTKVIQFTAGNGPVECQYVVAQVLKVFLKEGKQHGINTNIINKVSGTENRTIQSVTIQLSGEEINYFLKNWLGTIQWVGTSTFRKDYKRKNWFIGCFLLDDVQSMNIKENEISFQAVRSSGAGGQHVNKVSSAVRATHLPTNIQVFASDTRSQHKNKKIARERLKAKLENYNLEQLQENAKREWNNHSELERGNPVRVFKGNDFKKQVNDKSYKKDRNKLKNDLRRRNRFED